MSATDRFVRDYAPADEDAFRRLYAAYVAFLASTVEPAVVSHTIRRFSDPSSGMFCRIAEAGGVVRGFAVCLLHEGTWVTRPICYLEDLFVDPAARGAGLGRALIEDLAAICRDRGYARLYWHTQASNATARRLYDRFAAADGAVRYTMRFP